jgi:transposase
VEIGDVNIGNQSIIKGLKVLLQLKLCFLFIQIWKMTTNTKLETKVQKQQTSKGGDWRCENWKL